MPASRSSSSRRTALPGSKPCCRCCPAAQLRLIDPSYEEKQDYDRVFMALKVRRYCAFPAARMRCGIPS